MQEDEPEIQEAVEVVTTAKLITELIAAVSEIVSVDTVVPATVTKTVSTAAVVPAAVTAAPIKGNQHPVVELRLKIMVVVEGIVLVKWMVYLKVVVMVE
nr:hypothetical protein [Tanacetum cinerariifolium]